MTKADAVAKYSTVIPAEQPLQPLDNLKTNNRALLPYKVP